jgi:hypothetical protein
MEKSLQNNPYQKAGEAWNQQIQTMMQQWQKLFNG